MDFLIIVKDNLLPFLVVLTVLVFVHEMGHYLVARWNGVRVEVFSVGFGPELFGRNDRLGTRWRISAIPLGGYVKMFGDADVASSRGDALDGLSAGERAVSFHHKRLGQRTAIVIAGPAANFLFAILLLAGLYATVGQRHATTDVDAVMPESAAAEAGLAVGDRILEIDGMVISRFEELQRIVRSSPGIALSMRVDRQGETLDLTVTPRPVTENGDGPGASVTIGLLGVRSERVTLIRHDPLSAIWHAAEETWSLTRQTLSAVGDMITGRRTTDELGGTIADRADVWSGGGVGTGEFSLVHGAAVYQSWPDQSVSDSGSRWWTSGLLRGRSAARSSIGRAHPGMGVDRRSDLCDRPHAFRDLERPGASSGR